jgi:hypothetical protein
MEYRKRTKSTSLYPESGWAIQRKREENNHYENLRYATHTENSRNPKIQTNTSSVCKGVPLDKQSNKWTAHIRINRKLKHLGVFTNEREAAEAYNAAAVEHYGDFARLNIFED